MVKKVTIHPFLSRSGIKFDRINLIVIAGSVVASFICQEGQSAKTIPIFPDFLPLFSQFLANVSLSRGTLPP